MRCRLLAIDLDGTLLRDDGQIDPRDSNAIRVARAAGITVTLSTGRMPFRTLPYARQLALEDPLICGDGTVTLLPSGVLRAVHPLSIASRAGLLDVAAQIGLPLLALTPNAVLGLEGHRELATTQLATWSDHFEPITALDELLAPRRPIVTAFVLGDTDATARAAGLYAKSTPPGRDQADVFRVRLPGEDTLRVLPPGVDKGTALAALARSRGLAREEVGAVGDWYNDLPMLRWAHWSFAMGHAPDEVVKAARRKLQRTAATGGAIAELVEQLVT